MVNIELNAILMQKGWERMGKEQDVGTFFVLHLTGSLDLMHQLARRQQCFRKKRDELEDINQEMDGALGQP